MAQGPINSLPNSSGLNYQNYSQNYNPYKQFYDTKMEGLRTDFQTHQQEVHDSLLEANVQPVDEPADLQKTGNELTGLLSLLSGNDSGGGFGGFRTGGGGDFGSNVSSSFGVGQEIGQMFQGWGNNSGGFNEINTNAFTTTV